jgi:hypothetical protein
LLIRPAVELFVVVDGNSPINNMANTSMRDTFPMEGSCGDQSGINSEAIAPNKALIDC